MLNDQMGFGRGRQESVMSLGFPPWMIGWMVTAFSKSRKKGGRATSTLEEAGHHGFDFEDPQEWMLTFS